MTIELKPDQELLLKEAVRQGRFNTVDEAVEQAIRSIASQVAPRASGGRPDGKKSLVQLFAESPMKGVNLRIERAKDSSRPADL